MRWQLVFLRATEGQGAHSRKPRKKSLGNHDSRIEFLVASGYINPIRSYNPKRQQKKVEDKRLAQFPCN
jgi:hypothetical protein